MNRWDFELKFEHKPNKKIEFEFNIGIYWVLIFFAVAIILYKVI